MPPIQLSQQASRTPSPAISYFMKLALETPGLISLAAGFVDEMSLPASEIAVAARDVLAQPEQARSALQYGTPQGYLPLRSQVLDRFAASEGTTAAALNLSVHDVVITTGSQQLLYLLGEVLLDPGDIVITEAPSYFVNHGILASRGVQVKTVPMDDQGMNTDALEKLLIRLEKTGEIAKLKLIYTVDYYQNPSGLTLSRARRPKLMELVRRFSRDHRIIVLEDAAYRELRFSGDDLPSIKSFDPENRYVAYTSTFSKPCAPGLKTGYGIVPDDLLKPVLNFKGNHDFGSANLNQQIVERLLASGAYDRHVAQLREVYRLKAEATLAAIEEAFGDCPEVHWTTPTGGLYVWMKFPPHVPTGPGSAFLEAAMREGVLYIPGQYCHIGGDDGPLPDSELRLCYGVATIEQIREAIPRLSRAAKPLLNRKPKVELATASV